MILAENPLYLPALPANGEVTLINTVPSAIAELVRMKGLPDSVKTVVLAGEALPETLVEEIYRSTSVEKVYNMYGPTEVGYCTSTLVRRGKHVTIGKPLANVQAYVLDTHRRPVPIGVPGEAYFAGEGSSSRLLWQKRPDSRALPSQSLRGQPAQPDVQNGRHMPLAGRWQLQYLGRRDHQIKLRGFRVELGEIEAALDRHQAVRRSVVVVRKINPD